MGGLVDRVVAACADPKTCGLAAARNADLGRARIVEYLKRPVDKDRRPISRCRLDRLPSVGAHDFASGLGSMR